MFFSEFNLWAIIEWTGAILAIIGSFIMATHKLEPIPNFIPKFFIKLLSPIYPWFFWLVSSFLYIILFLHTQQHGLLVMVFGGIIVNAFGLYQWAKNEKEINKKITTIFFISSFIITIIATFFLINLILDFNYKYLEWTGSLMGMAAIFLLASRHDLSFICWFLWIFSNTFIMILSLNTHQYGFFFLQVSYMITNIYGCILWIKDRKKHHNIN